MIFRWNNIQLTLRNPDLRDKQTLLLSIIKKRMMDGSWLTYISPYNVEWEWTFSYICRNDMLSAIDFVKNSAGQQITVIDHLERTWKGRLITPSTEYATPARSNNQFTWKFQGFQY